MNTKRRFLLGKRSSKRRTMRAYKDPERGSILLDPRFVPSLRNQSIIDYIWGRVNCVCPFSLTQECSCKVGRGERMDDSRLLHVDSRANYQRDNVNDVRSALINHIKTYRKDPLEWDPKRLDELILRNLLKMVNEVGGGFIYNRVADYLINLFNGRPPSTEEDYESIDEALKVFYEVGIVLNALSKVASRVNLDQFQEMIRGSMDLPTQPYSQIDKEKNIRFQEVNKHIPTFTEILTIIESLDTFTDSTRTTAATRGSEYLFGGDYEDLHVFHRRLLYVQTVQQTLKELENYKAQHVTWIASEATLSNITYKEDTLNHQIVTLIGNFLDPIMDKLRLNTGEFLEDPTTENYGGIPELTREQAEVNEFFGFLRECIQLMIDTGTRNIDQLGLKFLDEDGTTKDLSPSLVLAGRPIKTLLETHPSSEHFIQLEEESWITSARKSYQFSKEVLDFVSLRGDSINNIKTINWPVEKLLVINDPDWDTNYNQLERNYISQLYQGQIQPPAIPQGDGGGNMLDFGVPNPLPALIIIPKP
jgi:hypothetical protein